MAEMSKLQINLRLDGFIFNLLSLDFLWIYGNQKTVLEN